jgi:hypothetical protein
MFAFYILLGDKGTLYLSLSFSSFLPLSSSLLSLFSPLILSLSSLLPLSSSLSSLLSSSSLSQPLSL